MPVTVRRGGRLVSQGDLADALYVVLTGRFEVTVDERKGVVHLIAHCYLENRQRLRLDAGLESVRAHEVLGAE